ncbi:MANSC domain-containing protein 4 [Ambystoma mexicanum]|uniref:MANSC domain-containing protein 4 n=1 Tax=Ambystoma mexicanum TaxID=8296 RepID=UPI0037E80E32
MRAPTLPQQQHVAADMFLTVAVAALLGTLGMVWRSDCLCSPTAYYQNCWIRRFPGLLVDMQESQRRGAQVLRLYWESTAQRCSRACCLLRNVSCNLAVFYYETTHSSNNCLHVYCPTLESCIIRNRNNVILYNITVGADPDLLVFEKTTFKDLNPRSSFPKMERQNTSKTPEPERCQSTKLTSMTLSSQASPHSQTMETAMSRNRDGSDAVQKSLLTTASWQKSPSEDRSIQQTILASESTDWTNISDNPVLFSTFTSIDNKSLSHMPHLAHLNSSKQHLNETKGYSGRNQSADGDHGGQEPLWVGAAGKWLVPVALCSSLSLICCCCLFLAVGHRRKRTGHYRPVRKVDRVSGQTIKYTFVNDSL